MSKGIEVSLVLYARDEGLMLIPSLRSAVAAKRHCEENGISAETILFAVEGSDEVTDAIVADYRHQVDVVAAIDADAPSDDHLRLASGDFICILKGGDVWQTSWPATAHAVARENGSDAIFHTELFAEFGRAAALQQQLETADLLFEPLHLCADSYFRSNLFCRKELLVRFPLAAQASAEEFGSEYWRWTCETIDSGVARIAVPQTVYFRRKGRPKRRHAYTRHERLVEPIELFLRSANADHGEVFGWAEPPSADQVQDAALLRFEQPWSSWLLREIRRAGDFEFDIFALFKLDATPIKTQQLQNALAYSLSLVALHSARETLNIAAIDCDILSPSALAFAQRSVAAAAKRGPIVVFCGDACTGGKLAKIRDGAIYVNYKLVQRTNHGGVRPFFNLLAIIAGQFSVRTIANYNSDVFDKFAAEYRPFLQLKGVRAVRAFSGRLMDAQDSARDRVTLGKILNDRCPYDEFWTWDPDSSAYLGNLLFARGTEIRLTRSGRSERLLLEMLWGDGASSAPMSVEKIMAPQDGEAVEVSCVLLLHREGDLAVPTLRNVAKMLKHARSRSVRTELVVVVDDGDKGTCDALDAVLQGGLLPQGTRVLKVSERDPGLSRMAGVEAAKGDHIAFLDGDDLYSENWLTAALDVARNARGQTIVVHPEISVSFGEEHLLLWHVDELKYDIPYGSLIFENFWTALSLVPRSLLLSLPIEPCALEQGFGHEDWHWNMTSLAKGAVHCIALGTCHFIRKKKGLVGQNRTAAAHDAVVRMSEFPAMFMWGEIQEGARLRRITPSKSRTRVRSRNGHDG